MAESHDSIDRINILPSDVDLDSRQSVLRAFLHFAKAEPILTLEDWYTIPSDFDQILENFKASYSQIWEALPNNLRYNIHCGRELYLPMGNPAPEHEATARAIAQLLLDKLQTLQLQGSVVQSFVKSVVRGGTEQILLDSDSKFCPDEQLACVYDPTPPIIIEVSNSQKFYGTRGLKWKLSQEIIESLGDINVGLGLKIYIEETAWNPRLTLYRPNFEPNSTETGGTLEIEEVFEQIPLIGLGASNGSFTLTLRDFISGQNLPAILDKFPGLENELDLSITITFAEIAASIAAAKVLVDTKSWTRAAVSSERTSASLNITKIYPDLRDPNSA